MLTVRITEKKKKLPQKQGGDQMKKTSRLQRQKQRVKTARQDTECMDINSYILNCIPKTKANVCQKVSLFAST